MMAGSRMGRGERDDGVARHWSGMLECSYAAFPAESGERVAPRDAPLAGLSGSRVSDRFRSWRGMSGKRYVFSVYRTDDHSLGLDSVPAGVEAVVIAAERRIDGTRVLLWMDETAGQGDGFFQREQVRSLAVKPQCELHLHLLAADASERRAILDDLAG